MLQELSIRLFARHGNSINHRPGSFFDRSAKYLPNEYHAFLQQEGQVFVKIGLYHTGTEVIDDHFLRCNGCQFANVRSHG